MKKRGFTLIELMGVLIILGVLSLIIIPIVSNVLKEQKQKQYDQQIANIELMAKNFGSDNLVILPSEDGESMDITLGQLKSMGYVEKNIINPITEEEISNCARVTITKSGQNYNYAYDKDTENDTSCGDMTGGIIISAPVTKYIKKNEITSYIVTINDNDSENIINKYEIDRTKVSLVGETDAIYNIVEGNGIYRIVIRGGDQDGEVGLRLESKAILKNEIEDVIGIGGIEAEDTVVIDNTNPTITFGTNGSSTWSKEVSSTISVYDNLSGGVTSSYKYVYTKHTTDTPTNLFTSGTSYSQSGVTGNYYLIASACDRSGNCTTETSKVFKLDNTKPTIAFETNGNSNWAKSASSTITVSDEHSQGDTATYKYVYSTSSSATPSTAFTSGSSYSKNSVSGDYYLIATACDNAGNCATKTSNVFKLDNTEPTITFGTNGNSTWSKSASSIITVSDEHSQGDTATYKYVYSTSSTATPSTAFTSGSSYSKNSVTGNYYLIATACDNVGNCTTETSKVFKLDNTAPTITFGTDGNSSWAKSASSTISISDNHSQGDTTTYKYIYSTSSTATPSTAFTSGSSYSKNSVTGDYYLIAKACDNAGNCTTETSKVFKLDNTAPTITFGTDGNSSWAKSASSTISVSDSHSQGDTTTYKYIYSTSSTATPSTAFTSGSNYSQTSGTGNYYLIAKACDKVGNCTTETSNAFKLDNTKPTITFGTDGNSNWAKSASSTISVSDSHSQGDTATYKYIYSTSSTATPSTKFTSGSSYSQTSGTGNYYLIATACDKAGNCADTKISNVFKLDNTKPTISSATANSCSSNKRTITVKGSDSNSGISGYLITTSTSTPSASSFSSSTATSWTSSAYSSGTYYAWIKDAVGNISSSTTVSVGACDTTGPTITFGTDGSSSYVAQASTTVTATDSSGISSISYGWSTSNSSTSAGSSTTSGSTLSSKCSRTTDGDCYLYVKACDTHGNCSTKRTSAFKLDVTAPTITITNYYACATGLHEDYTMTDSGSGVAQYGKIHCDLNLGSDSCYGSISGTRIKSITPTSSKSISSEWTTCNTSGSDQPTGTTGCAFWVKAFDAVGNMSKKNTTKNLKAFSSTTACSDCP